MYVLGLEIISQYIFTFFFRSGYDNAKANITNPAVLNEIRSGTVISWLPVKTCMDFYDCNDCQEAIGFKVRCIWCPATGRCYSGRDKRWQNDQCLDSLTGRNIIGKRHSCKNESTNSALENYFNQREANYQKLNWNLHANRTIHQQKDNIHYDLKIKQHTSHIYWHILHKGSTCGFFAKMMRKHK